MDVGYIKRLLSRTERKINALEEQKQMLNEMLENRYKLARLKNKDYKLWKKAKQIVKENEEKDRIRRGRKTYS